MAKRILFASDLHFGHADYGTSPVWAPVHVALENRWNAIPNVDAYVVCGDVSTNGLTTEYNLYNNFDASIRAKFLPAAGDGDRTPGNINNWAAAFNGGKSLAPSTLSASVPWYSVMIGGWKIIALDIAEFSTYGTGSAQYAWLQTTLAAVPTGTPILAFFHQMRYSIDTSHGDTHPNSSADRTLAASVGPIWALLQSYKTDIIVNGHCHINQVYKKLGRDSTTSAGPLVALGIKEFTMTAIRDRTLSLAYGMVDPDYYSASDPTTTNRMILQLDLTSTADGDAETGYAWKMVKVSDGTTPAGAASGSDVSLRNVSTPPDPVEPSPGHYRVGSFPDNPATNGTSIVQVSGSVDSRLHTDTQWVHTGPGGQIFALDYGTIGGVPYEDVLHPLAFKKEVTITGYPIGGPTNCGQWEDMSYDSRTGKNDIYIANCGNIEWETIDKDFWLYRVPEPTDITAPNTVGQQAISGSWVVRWPTASHTETAGVDCGAMVVAPVAVSAFGIKAGMVCFIPKGGGIDGIYRMPDVAENLTQGAGTIHTLVKCDVEWSIYNAITRADWCPDGSEIMVATGGTGPPTAKAYTTEALVFNGTNLAFKRYQDIAMAWAKSRYPALKYDKSYGNESLHFRKDSTVNNQRVIVASDDGELGLHNDVAKTIYTSGGVVPGPRTKSPIWRWKESTAWRDVEKWTDPLNKEDPYSRPDHTNILMNPSFEQSTAGWSKSTGCTITRATDLKKYGTWSGVVTAVSPAGNIYIDSENFKVTEGESICASGWTRWKTGTPKNVRLDIIWENASGTVISTSTGTSTATNNTAFVQLGGASIIGAVAPAGAVYTKLRVTVISPANTDVVYVDGFQLERSTTLPPYNPLGDVIPKDISDILRPKLVEVISVIPGDGGGGGWPAPLSANIYPDATNTGILGASLTTVSGDVHFSTNNEVVSNKNFLGDVFVDADNISFHHCRFWKQIDCLRTAYTGTRIWNCTHGNNNGDTVGAAIKGHNWSMRRCNIFGILDGVRTYNNCNLEDTYIHDLFRFPDSSQSSGWTHNDGLQSAWGDGVLIRHNRIECWLFQAGQGTADNHNRGSSYEQTSGVGMYAGGGEINHTTVEDNVIRGNVGKGINLTGYPNKPYYNRNATVINNKFGPEIPQASWVGIGTVVPSVNDTGSRVWTGGDGNE